MIKQKSTELWSFNVGWSRIVDSAAAICRHRKRLGRDWAHGPAPVLKKPGIRCGKKEYSHPWFLRKLRKERFNLTPLVRPRIRASTIGFETIGGCCWWLRGGTEDRNQWTVLIGWQGSAIACFEPVVPCKYVSFVLHDARLGSRVQAAWPTNPLLVDLIINFKWEILR